jgi:hypothetical protein
MADPKRHQDQDSPNQTNQTAGNPVRDDQNAAGRRNQGGTATRTASEPRDDPSEAPESGDRKDRGENCGC